MAGLVHLPRMIDKARAKHQDTLGEYIYPCPLDQILLEFLEIGDEDFQKMAVHQKDGEIQEWTRQRCRSKSPEAVETINRKILEKQPDTDEKRKKFLELRTQLDPSRTDVTTWVDLIDLEEGRLTPRMD
ncbi:MAG: DUF5069 domain-containing protein [Nitrospinaceae bacterium]|nr:DUF5069 domain-containing protein [Nitrospinaceae bacterium]NIR57984.1 DUF5069 domain-containing protein [Nitrospinaceae bacterium]NIS88447.1 DUF5069 domain-containing protein [Nitrospinaceae bacterium]NIT85326.1 DUF5069 domain-containing protein [Nitrospinaceae bacterium]NIU47478.1 DUF5069 domain-containing protein [Nitrospinaceae bacterium]